MAIINFEFTSEILVQPTKIKIFIPDKILRSESIDNTPIIYLLHGKNGNEESWGLETNAYQYSKQYGFIMIMPYAANSFYTNMIYGERYWDFIADELPKVLMNCFKISSAKENTFVCGYSMGGYGALKLGLTHPERYEAIAALSGSLRSIEETKTKIECEERQDLFYAFGDYGEKVRSENDIYYLTEKALKEGRKLPKLYIYCGRNDSLYKSNIMYKQFAENNGIDLVFKEDGGNHSFKYWNEELKAFLELIRK